MQPITPWAKESQYEATLPLAPSHQRMAPSEGLVSDEPRLQEALNLSRRLRDSSAS